MEGCKDTTKIQEQKTAFIAYYCNNAKKTNANQKSRTTHATHVAHHCRCCIFIRKELHHLAHLLKLLD